jgi:hypothetical protein
METMITTPDMSGFLEKLEGSRLAKENNLRNLEKQAKTLQKEIKDDDELIRVLRNRLGVTGPVKKSSDYGNKAEMLRIAISRIPNHQFVLNDVVKELKRSNPDMEISNTWLRTALWSLADKQKLIKQISKGDNQNAALYEKVSASSEARRTVANHRVNGAMHIATSGLAVVGIGGVGTLTIAALENFVSEKNRRMDEITTHFGVDETTVTKLFQPVSRVFEASRGWIKIRE